MDRHFHDLRKVIQIVATGRYTKSSTMAASGVSSAPARDIFDYVVVGGGLGGLVVATRLAEDPTVSVCVLEAGQDVSQDPNIQIPGAEHHHF